MHCLCQSLTHHLSPSERITHRSGMPSSPTILKPTQMSPETRRTHDSIRCSLHLLVRQRLIHRHGIVLSINREHRHSCRQQAIHTRRITVVRAFCWVSPGRSLDLAVELVQVLEFLDLGEVELGVG